MLFRVKSQEQQTQVNISETSLQCWHEQLDHVNARTLKQLLEIELVAGVSLDNKANFFCELCQMEKAHRLPFNKQREERVTKPSEMVHSNLCGPMSEISLGGARFFLMFTDDASEFRYVYFLKHKSDVFDRFENRFEKNTSSGE